MVKYEELKAVVGDAKWKINNLMDGQRQPRDVEIIVAEALQLVGSEPQYKLLLYNCEHFATGLRYGISRSLQVSLPGEIYSPPPRRTTATTVGLQLYEKEAQRLSQDREQQFMEDKKKKKEDKKKRDSSQKIYICSLDQADHLLKALPRTSLEDPQPGDLIEIPRQGGVIKHWAVYVGDGFVVHLTTPNESGATSSSSSGSSSGNVSITKAMVKYEELKAVVGDAKWKINNLRDGQHQPRDAKIIVAEALQLVGSEPHYKLFTYNCEHFATEMRYGIRRSRQAFIGTVRIITLLLTPIAAIPGYAWVAAIVGVGWLAAEAMKKVADMALKAQN
ncbi:unnamed protein product [Boreogadus saida]